MPHQPEHQDPVQSHHREEREHRAIQKSRELLRLPVEGQHVANQPWDFFTLREVVVHIPVVLVDPLPARIFEVLLQLLVAERNLHLVVDASQSELLQPTQNGRRVVLLLEVPRVAARVGHHSLSIALGASVPLAVSPGSVSRFIVVAHDVPLRVSWGLLALVSVLVRIEIPSQLLKELACVRAAEQDIVDQVEHSRENEPQIVLQKEGQRDPPQHHHGGEEGSAPVPNAVTSFIGYFLAVSEFNVLLLERHCLPLCIREVDLIVVHGLSHLVEHTWLPVIVGRRHIWHLGSIYALLAWNEGLSLRIMGWLVRCFMLDNDRGGFRGLLLGNGDHFVVGPSSHEDTIIVNNNIDLRKGARHSLRKLTYACVQIINCTGITQARFSQNNR